MVALLADLEAAPSVVNATDLTLWPLIAVHQDFHFVPMESAGLPRLVSELRRLGITRTTTARCTCSRTSRRTS